MSKISKSLLAAALTTALFIPAQAFAAVNIEDAVSTVKKPKKITDRKHPDYVRCRSEPIIGSLARKRRVCMKNKQWAAHSREGSKRSREFVEDMKVGGPAGN